MGHPNQDYFYLITKNGFDTISGIFHLLSDTTIELEIKFSMGIPAYYYQQPFAYPLPAINYLIISHSDNIRRIEFYNLLVETAKIIDPAGQ